MPEHSEEIAQMRLDYSTDQRVWDLLDEVERLRDALGVILAGLTDALADPMGARPSQVTTLYSTALHAMWPISKEGDRG